MKKKDYGTKFICYQCGCRFYDMKKPQPVCPKCGVDQSAAPHKVSHLSQRHATGVPVGRSVRSRRRKEGDWEGGEEHLIVDDDGKTEGLEEGLSLVEDDAFSETDEDDSIEIE
jgi:hypothetical protein